jgi:cytidylate kinase
VTASDTSSALIIAIDGGAGTGTSTAAEGVAKALGIPHLNTGSMYRAIAWECQQQGVDWSDSASCDQVAESAQLEITDGKVTAINGKDVSSELYVNGMGRGASAVSAHRGVRHAMVRTQREYGQEHSVVMEGRDIGTNVFPDTPFRFYFVCDAAERVRRLKAGGRHDETVEHLLARDRDDEAHEQGAFIRHRDAIEIDTTAMPVDAVIAKIVETVRAAS